MPERISHVAIAVRVVDNFGDAGVAWRLARQIADEHACEVTLWIDDAAPLARFVRGADATDAVVDGVRVRRLPPLDAPKASPLEPWPQLLVEAFGCALPPPWLDAMEAATVPPVWVNLEYLSAEGWVDSAHGLPSPHPTRRLKRWFFYPGFTPRTGGLLRERALATERDAFLASPGHRARAWAEAGLAPPPDEALATSLFCYPSATVTALLRAWADGIRPVHAIVPEGVAADAVATLVGTKPHAGSVHAVGALTLAVVPFVDQRTFDRRLWACDFAVVRGEDSFVRAQWATVPFAWHIYPQEEAAHRAKLAAFLARYTRALEPRAAGALVSFMHAFNAADGDDLARDWPGLAEALPSLRTHAQAWAARLAEFPDLGTQLVGFARSRL